MRKIIIIISLLLSTGCSIKITRETSPSLYEPGGTYDRVIEMLEQEQKKDPKKNKYQDTINQMRETQKKHRQELK